LENGLVTSDEEASLSELPPANGFFVYQLLRGAAQRNITETEPLFLFKIKKKID